MKNRMSKEELKEEHTEIKTVTIEIIDETQQPELADTFDYYYVPTFYIDGEKVHEGGIFKPKMEAVLCKSLED